MPAGDSRRRHAQTIGARIGVGTKVGRECAKLETLLLSTYDGLRTGPQPRWALPEAQRGLPHPADRVLFRLREVLERILAAAAMRPVSSYAIEIAPSLPVSRDAARQLRAAWSPLAVLIGRLVEVADRLDVLAAAVVDTAEMNQPWPHDVELRSAFEALMREITALVLLAPEIKRHVEAFEVALERFMMEGDPDRDFEQAIGEPLDLTSSWLALAVHQLRHLAGEIRRLTDEPEVAALHDDFSFWMVAKTPRRDERLDRSGEDA